MASMADFVRRRLNFQNLLIHRNVNLIFTLSISLDERRIVVIHRCRSCPVFGRLSIFIHIPPAFHTRCVNQTPVVFVQILVVVGLVYQRQSGH